MAHLVVSRVALGALCLSFVALSFAPVAAADNPVDLRPPVGVQFVDSFSPYPEVSPLEGEMTPDPKRWAETSGAAVSDACGAISPSRALVLGASRFGGVSSATTQPFHARQGAMVSFWGKVGGGPLEQDDDACGINPHLQPSSPGPHRVRITGEYCTIYYWQGESNLGSCVTVSLWEADSFMFLEWNYIEFPLPAERVGKMLLLRFENGDPDGWQASASWVLDDILVQNLRPAAPLLDEGLPCWDVFAYYPICEGEGDIPEATVKPPCTEQPGIIPARCEIPDQAHLLSSTEAAARRYDVRIEYAGYSCMAWGVVDRPLDPVCEYMLDSILFSSQTTSIHIYWDEDNDGEYQRHEVLLSVEDRFGGDGGGCIYQDENENGWADSEDPHACILGPESGRIDFRPVPCMEGHSDHEDVIVGICNDRNGNDQADADEPVLLALTWQMLLGTDPNQGDPV